ncbi:hypothetical protein [Pseudomonas sp. SDO5591_S426]
MHITNSRRLTEIKPSDIETISAKQTLNSFEKKIAFASNSSRELCRTLDKYGIDIRPDELQKARTDDKPIIFAHKDREGNFNLDTGLYISDPKSGDAYGQFRFHEGRATTKYQVTECTKLMVDEKSLDALRNTYHELTGVTSFLRDILDLKPGKDLEIFKNHPEYFSYLPPMDTHSNGYLIFPNAPYIDLNSLTETSSTLKDRRDGICLGAYAIHPNQNLSLIEKIDDISNIDDRNIKANRNDNTRTLSDIAAQTNVKYLASILDLDASDVPMLESLKEHVLAHLSEVYDVDSSKEKVQLYFHFPPADVTATLHLHVRVNVADHPLNQDRSFNLSDIITTLDSGRSINDLILQRHDGALYTLVNENDSIRVIPDKSKVKNPNILNLT